MAAPADISPEALLDLLGTLTADAKRRRERRARLRLLARRASRAALVFVVFAAATFAALHFLRHHHSPTARPAVHRQPASKATTAPTHTTPAVVAAKTRPAAAGLAVLTVRATRGSSWMMARAGDANGRLLYQGVLETGRSVTLRARRVWVRFGASSYLDLRLNGKAVRLAHSGTVDAVFTRAGAASPTAG